MDRRSSFVIARPWKRWQFKPFPPGNRGRSSLAVLRNCSELTPRLFERGDEMYSGTLINDLFSVVERAENSGNARRGEGANSRFGFAKPALSSDSPETSKSEQFPQSLGLSPADRNLGLLLVVHAQLVGAFEPGNDFADAVDVHQVGAVSTPKKIRV